MNAIDTPLVIGVTSHRNIPARELEPIRARVRELFAQLQREFPHSPLTILSPLAEGGDQLVAEEGLQLGATLIAPLPFARELYAQDFTDDATRAAFDSLCARAHMIHLPLLPNHTLDDIALSGVERNRQYAQAGAFVARHCHLLLAIWDGKTSDRLGGTAQVVEYYLGGAMPGHIERRRTTRHLGRGDERLVCHLVCSRDEAGGAPQPPLQPGQLVWREGSHAGAPDESMPSAFHAMFAHTDEFNADAAKYHEKIASDFEASAGTANANAGSRPASIAARFHVADWLAVHFQKRVLLAMRVTYTVAALMGIAFAVYDNLNAQNYMIYVFLLLFVTGIVISAIARRRDWHRKYLDYRALAEGLRVQCYWRRAGISLTDDPEFAHNSLIQKLDIELGWTRNVMRSAGLEDDTPRGGDLDAVIHEWVGDGQVGQLGYYQRRGAQRERTHRVTEVIGAVSLYAGIAISAVLAAFAYRLSADVKNDLIVIMAVFSITSAVREAYAYRKADKELIKQYRFMQRIFADARKQLDRADSDEERREILRALGETALAEHAEWAVMHRQRPLEPGRM
ncbi:MAG TPA: hypothetical protein VN693_02745 [Rhodanobacteraceae bacterium]|nr:hypothetical protein [Rhodanobacteraceae bacterium]